MRLLTMTLAAFLAAGPALAREITDDQRAALEARVAEFSATMTDGDMADLLGYTPPPVRATLAEMSGMDEAQLVEAMRAAMDAAMQGATIEGFSMDVDAATVEETPDGSRAFVLIPTTTDVAVEGQGTMRAASQTLALEDGGEWWLVRIDDPQQTMILAQAYPEFAGVTFPAGTVTPVQ